MHESRVATHLSAATFRAAPAAQQPVAAQQQLLPTKLFVPLLAPDVLSRSRLLERLGAAGGAGLLLVSAPPGAGKTTLIAEWIGRCGRAAGWLSLEATDDDPFLFLGYLVEAANAVAPGVGARTSALLHATPPPDWRIAAQTLVADLANAACDGVIVLDDYHAVSDPVIHEIVTLLVERGPAETTVVVITRSDPPLPLPRLRVRRQLCEIREADLRFEPAEAAEFIRRSCGRPLRAESITSLVERTEGWAAGLQLAGLALRAARDPDAFVAGFRGTHVFVADYLADEVLAAMPERQHRFVVRASLLERLSGPLCDAALGTSGSQALLEELSRANLFLVPLDAERRWFRFHHLFADLLRRRVQEEDEQEQRMLLARAADWCMEHGVVGDAVAYAARAGDTARAADIVARHGLAALAAGEAVRALRWIHLLPDAAVRASPDHCVIAAWSHSLLEHYEPIGALAHGALDLAARGARPHPHVNEVVLHARLLAAAVEAMEDCATDGALQEIAEVLAAATPGDLPLRASAEIVRGKLLMLRGRYDAALPALRRAREIGVAAGSHLLRLAAASGLAEVLLAQGRLRSAVAAVADEWMDGQLLREVLGSQVANLCAIQAAVHLERDDLDAAELALRRSQLALGAGDAAVPEPPAADRLGRVRHTPFHSSAPVAHHGFAAHLGLLCRRGDTAAAERRLDALEAALAGVAEAATERVLLTSLRGRMLAADGRRTALRRLLDREPERSTGCAFWDAHECLARSRALLGAGDPAAALALLEPLLAGWQEGGAGLTLADAHIVRALAACELHRDAEAGEAAAAALELTGPEGRVRPWLEAGVAAVPPLERAVAAGIATPATLAHAVSLLGRLRRQPATKGTAPRDPLSVRELEVLRLVASGRTNQEIGAALFLAVGTVKKHTHNIYAKLGVANRAQAVRAGQERGLLGPQPGSPAE